MSRWMYQMSEAQYPMENYRREVRQGKEVRWPTRRRIFARDAPAPGDIIVLFYAVAGNPRPGVCGLGIVTKYLPKTRRFVWLPLPPTNKLKQRPWWNERVKDIIKLVKAQTPQGTMYQLPAALDEDLRRGLFAWANAGPKTTT